MIGGRRFFTTTDRTWHAIAGHGVDHKRLSKHDFEILSVVASHGAKGVLQPTVTKVTGQDKRSVPHRTDRLAENGYITKETVVGSGTRTSLLRMARYAHDQKQHKVATDQRGARSGESSVVYHERWFHIMLRSLRDNNNIITVPDLWLDLGIIEKHRLPKRQLARCLRRLAEVGCVRRVTAKLLTRDGESLTTDTAARERFVDAIQLLREPAELDRLVWLKDSAKPRAARTQDETLDEDESSFDSPRPGDEDGEFEGDHSFAAASPPAPENQFEVDKDNELDDLDLLKDRVPPCWRPDVPLPNLIHGVVEAAGEAGLTSTNLAQRVTGFSWKRPMDEVTAHLTDSWQHSQPPHLRHLTLVRTSVGGKQSHYIYRTIEHHNKTPQTNVSQPDQDKWGFPSIALKELVGRDGRATLSEGRKGAIVEGMRDDDDHAVVRDEPGEDTPAASSRKKVTKSVPRQNVAKQTSTNGRKASNKAQASTTGDSPAQGSNVTKKQRVRPPKLPGPSAEILTDNTGALSSWNLASGTNPYDEVEEPYARQTQSPTPARVPQGPYSMRQRLSSTVVPESLLESTPETEFTTKENTPQSAGTEKRKNARRSIPGQPDVPLVRIREIKEEEYKEFDIWAQRIAEQRVAREVSSARARAVQAAPPWDIPQPSEQSLPNSGPGDATSGDTRKDVVDVPELPQERVAAVKAQVISRKEPGVYINPPGARKLKAETFVSRGRPRKALIAVIKSEQLRGLEWFKADNTPRFAPVPNNRKRTATSDTPPAQSVSEAEARSAKRQRKQPVGQASTEDQENASTVPLPQRGLANGSAQPDGVIAMPMEERTDLHFEKSTGTRQVVPITLAQTSGPQAVVLNGAAENGQQIAGAARSTSHAEQSAATQETSAATERLKILFSKPGRKSQATLSEIARLQKKLAKPDQHASKGSQYQHIRFKAPIVSTATPTGVSDKQNCVSQNAASPTRPATTTTSSASICQDEAEELARLHATAGRKTTEMLERVALLERKSKTQLDSLGADYLSTLAAELKQIREMPGRKTPELLARMAKLEMVLLQNNAIVAPATNVSMVGNAANADVMAAPAAKPGVQMPSNQTQDLVQTQQTVPINESPGVPSALTPSVQQQARQSQPEPIPSVLKSQQLSPLSLQSKLSASRELCDSAYVNAHPDQNFYHVGRGRWAPGLPPPGTSHRTAVRGPAATKTGSTPLPSTPSPAEQLPALREQSPQDGLVVKSPIMRETSQQTENNLASSSKLPQDSAADLGGDVTRPKERVSGSGRPAENDYEAPTRPGDISSLQMVPNQVTSVVSAKSKHGRTAAVERQETILSAVRRCGGVFPGDHEMWYVCASAWRHTHDGQTPARVTIDRTVQQLLNEGKLKKLQFSFATRLGGEMVKHVLAEAEIDESSPLLLEVQNRMVQAHPKCYLPDEVEVSVELREEATQNRRRAKRDMSDLPQTTTNQTTTESQPPSLTDLPDALLTVQQSATSAADADRKARLKGFADAQAMRLHKQQKFRESKLSSSHTTRKRRMSAISSEDEDDDDDDDDETPLVSKAQQSMQTELQLDDYHHDFSAALLPTEGLAQLKQILQQERAAFKPKTNAQQPPRKGRRPLGSLHTTKAKPRRRWWEDYANRREPADALLMRPIQSFHSSTGTFATCGLTAATEVSKSRTLRSRTLALEESAWNKLSSQDWTDIVQRANGLGSASTPKVFQNTVSGVVALRLPSDKLAEILSKPPLSGTFPGVDTIDEREPPLPESVSETPPPEPKPKRRYKSRGKKRARLDPEELPESDDEFVPGAAPLNEDMPLETPGRARIARGGKEFITRDRHSGPAFKDSDRLVAAIALISVVCGGINQDRLNWGLVAHALSFRYEGEFLRRRWQHFVRFRRSDVEQLRNAIIEPFLEAYDKGELPRVNFQDIGNTDWPGLFHWMSEKIPLVEYTRTSATPDLPHSREVLQRDYQLTQKPDQCDQDQDLFFTSITDTKRRELAIAYVHGVPLLGQAKPSLERQEGSILAKSWLRAVSMTKQQNYDTTEAARKVALLGRDTLEKVTAELVESHVLLQEKKNRQLPGRNYRLHHDVLGQFARWPSQPDESGYMMAIAQAWFKLNEYFKTQDHLLLVPVASDPDYLVLTNMCAQGFLRVKPILPEPTNDLDMQGPKLSPWGYGGYGYETKKVDPSVLRYDLVYSKTSGYKYRPELDPDVPVPMIPDVIPGEIGARIPLWVDIHGNLIEDAWEMVLRSILHLLVFRPGITIYKMEVAHNHKLWAWEIEMILGWMDRVGIAKRCGSGKEVNGVWKGGWRAGSWWFCTFLPEIAKWNESVNGH